MNKKQHDDMVPVFACDLMALSPEQRRLHQEHIALLFGHLVQEQRELPDGFAFRFAGNNYPQVTEFIQYERLCCPFLSFDLEVAPQDGPLWLQLTAQGDVKAFLREEIGHFVATP